MRATSIAIQSNPDVSALVVGGARLAIDIAVKYVTFFPKLSGMISHLSRYLEVLQSIVTRLKQDQASAENLIFKCAAELYGDWLDFCRAARRIFVDRKGQPHRWISLRTFIRAQWDPFEATFGGIERDFKEHLELLLHSNVTSQYTEIRDLVLLIQEDRKSQAAKDDLTTRIEFMHWIANIDYEEDHERISSKRHPGTGDWMIQKEEFQAWFKNPSSQLLWCYGKPGSGKTVLASHSLEYITTQAALNEEVGIVFCYLNYKQADAQRPRHILSSFIKQLCWKRPVLPQQLLDFYQKHILDARTPSLRALKDVLSSLAEDFQELYLVVDALDECEAAHRSELLDCIVELTSDHACTRAFITSRLENDIAQMFHMLKTPTIVIRAKNTADDISKYVNDSVTELVGANKLRVQNPQTRQRILERLVKDADGM